MNERSFSLSILNGSLDDAATLPFLDDLVEAGYGGVCFHPRDGMIAPYDSRYYWERLDALVGAARARGLAVWHYDEFPYPTGMGGGTFLEDNPHTWAHNLKFEPIATQPLAHSGEPGLIDIGAGRVLGVVRYRLKDDKIVEMREVSRDCGGYFDSWVWGHWHNLHYTATLLVHEEHHERAAAARWTRVYRPDVAVGEDERMLAIKVVPTRGHKGLSGHPDLTLPEVTDAFLEQIYCPLAEISQRHGLQQTPVFQDEVNFGSQHPWSREIAARLPQNGEHSALLLAKAHLRQSSDWENCRFQYRDACALALEENWFARVAAYCHENDLQMTGHLAGEESILGHAALLGDAFKALRHFDIPGYDFISSHFFDEKNRGQATGIKLAQSVAWAENRALQMAEVFAANGFQSTLNQQRGTLAWLALHGFTRTFDHSTYQSSLSVRKYDAPPVSNRFNPLHIGRADLWDWQNKFCDLLEEYHFAPDTLILFPFDALTRYNMEEREVWREPVERLENWFFEICGASLDCIFVPSYRLREVEINENGFVFNDHQFARFLVPPIESLHETTHRELQRFLENPSFSSAAAQITVFGDNASTLASLPSRPLENSRPWTAARPFLQSVRRNGSGDELQVLLNPHDEPLRVRCAHFPGAPVGVAGVASSPLEFDGENWTIEMAPRETQIFRATTAATSPKHWQTLQPIQARWRCRATNFLSLREGTLSLKGSQTRDFVPAPVSSLWQLPELSAHTFASQGFGLPYSLAPLAKPLAIEAVFSVDLQTDIAELSVVWDAESLPLDARIYWDDALLPATSGDFFERGNTVFPVPASELFAGAHQLKLCGQVATGAQGILEFPILAGQFSVRGDAAVLGAPLTDWQALPQFAAWKSLGVPEGFGPVEVELRFDVPDVAGAQWELHWPSLPGVAVVRANDGEAKRCSFEPRVLALPEVKSGDNLLQIEIYGSWNNIFSVLNRTENGWNGWPTLHRSES